MRSTQDNAPDEGLERHPSGRRTLCSTGILPVSATGDHQTRAGCPCYVEAQTAPAVLRLRQSKIANLKSKILILLLAILLPLPAFAAEKPLFERPNEVKGDEITADQKRAVELGLAYLASKQQASGAYGAYGGTQGHAGITALAGIAFMSAGNTPGRGKYGENVRKCLDYVLASCKESGLIASDNSHGPMYGHGFATLFLAEVYGMSPNEQLKEKLRLAVDLIERSQNREGGWRYQPVPYDADISVTICQVMALRAARDAGIKVNKNTIDMAIKYVRSCQNPDGGFSYIARQGSGSGFARSAAGVASLYYAGVFEGNDLKRGLDYLKQLTPGQGGGGEQSYFCYGHYYACQAMFLAGGEYWAKYYPAIRGVLIRRQSATTGSWTGEAGDDYATAMALIVLQMPNRYLPVFHGKGPGN